MALTHPQPSRFTVPRVASVGGLVLVVATVAVVVWRAHAPQPQPTPTDPWAGHGHQWARQSASLHLAAGQQHASVRIVYPRFGDTFTIIAARPRSAAITGYLAVDGRRMAAFECRSVSHATCRVGPFEGLERGAASRIWYLHIVKHTRAPAHVSVTVEFRRH